MRDFSRSCFAVCVAAAFYVLATSATAQTIALSNAGFEEGDGNGWAKDWQTVQHAGQSAYRTTQDASEKTSGKFSGKIERIASQEFGLFKQRIAVDAYVGKRLEFAGKLLAKALGEEGGGLYVRIDAAGDRILDHDFSSGSTKGTHDWRSFRAVVEIPDGARFIEVGVMLQDAGAVWADDLTLKVTEDAVTKVKPKVVPNANEITFDSMRPQPQRERRIKAPTPPEKKIE